MAHYSPLDNADQSNDVARQPDDKVVKAKVAPNKADKNVVEHSTADADHSRGQGSTDHNPTMEESTTQVVTATDFPAQLEGVKIGQPAYLADEDSSAQKADTILAIEVVTAINYPADDTPDARTPDETGAVQIVTHKNRIETATKSYVKGLSSISWKLLVTVFLMLAIILLLWV